MHWSPPMRLREVPGRHCSLEGQTGKGEGEGVNEEFRFPNFVGVGSYFVPVGSTTLREIPKGGNRGRMRKLSVS